MFSARGGRAKNFYTFLKLKSWSNIMSNRFNGHKSVICILKCTKMIKNREHEFDNEHALLCRHVTYKSISNMGVINMSSLNIDMIDEFIESVLYQHGQ